MSQLNRLSVIVSYLAIILLCVSTSRSAAPSMQMVDICTLCRCLDAKPDNEMVIECHGEDQSTAAGQPAKYFNPQGIVWPVSKDPVNNPLKIRAFFRNLQLPILPRKSLSTNHILCATHLLPAFDMMHRELEIEQAMLVLLGN